MEFKCGDLIETLNCEGELICGIVLTFIVRFHYTEVRILTDSRIITVVHDGRKGGIKLIQRIDNEERITK